MAQMPPLQLQELGGDLSHLPAKSGQCSPIQCLREGRGAAQSLLAVGNECVHCQGLQQGCQALCSMEWDLLKYCGCCLGRGSRKGNVKAMFRILRLVVFFVFVFAFFFSKCVCWHKTCWNSIFISWAEQSHGMFGWGSGTEGKQPRTAGRQTLSFGAHLMVAIIPQLVVTSLCTPGRGSWHRWFAELFQLFRQLSHNMLPQIVLLNTCISCTCLPWSYENHRPSWKNSASTHI